MSTLVEHVAKLTQGMMQKERLVNGRELGNVSNCFAFP